MSKYRCTRSTSRGWSLLLNWWHCWLSHNPLKSYCPTKWLHHPFGGQSESSERLLHQSELLPNWPWHQNMRIWQNKTNAADCAELICTESWYFRSDFFCDCATVERNLRVQFWFGKHGILVMQILDGKCLQSSSSDPFKCKKSHIHRFWS